MLSRPVRRVLTLLAAGALSALLAVGVVPTADASTPQSSTRWRDCRPTLDRVSTHVGAQQRSVIIVRQTSTTWARLSFYVRTDSRCSFTRKLITTTARLGWGGTITGWKRKQGTGKTPLGTWSMTESFGLAPEPDQWLPYHRVRKGDYWVGDNSSRYYNSLRNKASGGFRYRLPSSSINSSEYLPSFKGQYRYAVVINFNRQPVKKRYRGFGIFLHVKGDGATAGCVAITEHQLLTVLAYLHSGDKITISR